MSRTFAIVAVVAGAFVLASAAQAQTTWHVDNVNCPGPGTGSQGDPFCALQSGIDSAADGDAVLVAAGAYGELINFLGKSILVRSVSGAEQTTLDGGGSGPVVLFENGEDLASVLQGFTITGGVAEIGGGMSIVSSSPTVIDCLFVANAATDSAGAIDIFQGAPSIVGCAFIDNSAANYGGAVSNFESGGSIIDCVFEGNDALVGGAISNALGSASISGCSFIENSAGTTGGAIDNDTSMVSITNCVFDGNAAEEFGGAISNFDSDTSLADGTFVNNVAGDGGAISSEDSTPVVTRCLFESNAASGFGGGLDNFNSAALMTNCTFLRNTANEGGAIAGGGPVTNSVFIGNTASADGGALSLEDQQVTNCSFYGNTAGDDGGGIFNSTTSTVENCVLWANAPDQVFETPPANTLVRHSNVQGGWSGDGDNNLDATPLFIDPAGDDLRFLSNSPCIDAGNNNAVPPDAADLDDDGDTDEPTPFDLDGYARFIDGDSEAGAGVDMGAYEFQTGGPCPWDLNEDGGVGPFDLALLLNDWGPCPEPCDPADTCPADFDGSCAVGPLDLAHLLNSWGPCS